MYLSALINIRSDWFFPVAYLSLFDRRLTAVCRQKPTRRPCWGRETTRTMPFDTHRNLQRHRALLSV